MMILSAEGSKRGFGMPGIRKKRFYGTWLAISRYCPFKGETMLSEARPL